MKIRTWIVGAAALALSGNMAAAQTGATQWSYDNNVKAVACDDAYTIDGCCGDVCCGDNACCGDACCGDGVGCGDACGLAGFSLAGLLGMGSSPYTIGGWTQMGWHENATPLSQQFDDLQSFNDLPHQVNLHQQYLYLGKRADGSNGLDWGFRSDLMYGTDAQKTQAFGNPNAQGRANRGLGEYDASLDHGYYGWALPQLYGELAYNDFNVKVGHFYTIVGYETVTAPSNFFYSHALTMFNAQPFTHTGVLTSYTGFEGLTLYNGWTAGWDTGFTNTNGGSNYLGGFVYNLGNNATLAYTSTYGNFGNIDNGGRDSYEHSIVFNANVTDRINYVAQTDYLRTDNTNTDVFSILQYGFFSFTDRVRLGGRLEWFKLNGVSHYEATGGVNFQMWKNLVWRPEYRKDWAPGANYDLETFALDAILTY